MFWAHEVTSGKKGFIKNVSALSSMNFHCNQKGKKNEKCLKAETVCYLPYLICCVHKIFGLLIKYID